MSSSQGLGVGYGSMIEHDDGTASYRAPATLGQAFRVRIADVRGFSIERGTKALERTLRISGNGTDLAVVSVNHGVAERIEKWFRRHPSFRAAGGRQAGVPAPAAVQVPDSRLIADELTKLAQLRDQGVLTPAEFEQQKRRLLG